MTLDRGLNYSAILLTFAAIFAVLLVVLPGSLTTLYLVLATVVLAALVFERLRASRYRRTVAAALTAALFAQPGLLSSLLQPDGPVWIALVICTLVTSAADSVDRGNARSLIALGLSLAVVTVVDPTGMLLIAFVVPILLSKPLLHRDHRKALALALLVLFLPAAMVLLLSQLGIAPVSVVPFWPMLLMGKSTISTAQSPMISPAALVIASAMFLPAALVLFVWPAMRGGESRLFVLLGFAIIAAFAVATLLGSRHNAFWLAASLLPVTGALLASLKPTRNREFAATSATVLSMVGGWAALAL
jgi:hypothetical protein